MTTTALEREWLLLQKQHEGYELAALALKALGVVLLLLPGTSGQLVALLLVLWLQDAIVKTFQARLGARLLRIEQDLRDGAAPAPAMQLHSEWLASRAGGAALLREYAGNALRPTVAFPYALLIVLALAF